MSFFQSLLHWLNPGYFANPNAFWLLIIIPVWIFWYFLWYNKRRLVIPFSYDPAKLKRQGPDLSLLRFLPLFFQIIGFCLGIFALARPQSSFETVNRFSEGIDIMLLLDTSGSMEEADFQPNRLEVAKERAVQFIEGRVDDRIGIILFAEDAFSYAPLTLDYELLKKQISAIHSNMMPKNGTALGSAIAIGINRMLDSDSPSRIMILLTDGSNNRGQIEPVVAARLAAEKGIKIYSIGIGKKEYTIRDQFGRTSVKKSDLDEPAMQEIAEVTKGKFYRSTDEASLSAIFDQIGQMEKTEILEETQKDITDLYPRYLLWAMGFFLLSFFLMNTFLQNPLED